MGIVGGIIFVIWGIIEAIFFAIGYIILGVGVAGLAALNWLDKHPMGWFAVLLVAGIVFAKCLVRYKRCE